MLGMIASSMRRFGLAPDNKVDLKNGIGDRNKTHTGDPLNHMKINGKWSYSTLEFPLDLQTRGDLGHYMMFYINIPTKSAYPQYPAEFWRTNAPKKNKSDSLLSEQHAAILDHRGASKEMKQDFSEKGDVRNQSGQWKPGATEVVIARAHHEGGVGKNVQTATKGVKRLTKRTQDAVLLPMPPAIMTNYLASYKESEMGAMAGMGMAIAANAMARGTGEGPGKGSIADAVKFGLENTMATVKEGATLGKEMVKKFGAGLLAATAGGDIGGAYDKMNNKAANNFLEVMFTGLGFRKFSWTWKLAPRSPKELMAAHDIIKLFKFHMLPELPSTDFGRYYIVPAEFDIFYMFRGEENEWLNKISSCVCVNMDINYSPGGQWQTFRPIDGHKGAPPTEIDLKLDFMETKLITKEDVMKGY